MLDLSERRLANWERLGLARRMEGYTFADLVVLQSLMRLRKGGASPARIRRAVEQLRRRFGSMRDPLKELRLFCDSGRIAVQVGEAAMEAVSGQFLLRFDDAGAGSVVSFPGHAAQDALKAAEAARRFESSVWFDKALLLENRGAPRAEIIEAYKNALVSDPSSTGAMVNLGTVYFQIQDWDRAEEYYRRALEADPQYALAHFNLGNLFDERGDRAKALLHYLMAVRLDAGCGDAHYNLALLYQSSGQPLRAVRHWKIYLRIDRSSQWADVARQELEKLRRATVIDGARPAGRASRPTA